MPDTMPPLLGRYRLQAELGHGGFATVYRATDTMLEREVALKVLKSSWADDAKAVERFMREAKQASRLKHPNIVAIHDVGEAEGRLFIAMELVPGRSLQLIIAEDGALPWPRMLAILEQSASALDYAHKQGLVHRDIKPGNIILDESDPNSVWALLTDFGLVRGAEQASLSTGTTGGLLGTPEYIAPEIWNGKAATKASDIYALGCVVFYLLTGQVLFSATTPMAVLMRHVEGPVFPMQWPSGVPANVEAVLRRVLAKEPGERPASAAEFVSELRACELTETPERKVEAVRQAKLAAEVEQKRQAAERQAQAAAQQKRREEQERRHLAELAAQAAAAEKAKREAELADRKKRLDQTAALEESRLRADKREQQRQSAAGQAEHVGLGGSRPQDSPPPLARRSSVSRIWIWLTLAVVAGFVIIQFIIPSPVSPTPAPIQNIVPPAPTAAPVQPTQPPTPIQNVVPPMPTAAPLQPTQPPALKKKIAVALDVGGEHDNGYNQYSLIGAIQAANRSGLDLSYWESPSTSEYEQTIERFAANGANMIVTVGFIMGDATAAVARRYPNVQFAIVDNQYFPANPGDPDPYTTDLQNVTSLMFLEDQAGYEAGVLAGCMSGSGTIATVSGVDIPPVVRYVTGFQNGAKWVNPNIRTLNIYIPDFNNPSSGRQAALDFISQGADVIFGVAGNTGKGALAAAQDKGVMAIGVDVDQYYSYPEVRSALITSAQKKVDVATSMAVAAFANGTLRAGVVIGNATNGGIGLAPYHEWDGRIPQHCKDKVNAAINGLSSGSLTTGYQP